MREVRVDQPRVDEPRAYHYRAHHHGAHGGPAKRIRDAGRSNADEVSEFIGETTATFCYAVACTAADAGHRLPGGGMTDPQVCGGGRKLARL